jgi:hypothetical protein
MATRYWTGAVNGGTGIWDLSDTTNWSTTSGGAGGASVPGAADTVIFDANSGAGVCTLGITVTVGFLTMTNYTGTLDFVTYEINLDGGASGVFSGGTGYTLNGTKQLNCTYSGANIRSIVGSTAAESNIPNVRIQAGTGAFTFSGRVNNLDFTGFSGSLNTGSFNVYGSLVLSATMTVTGTNNAISFNGATAGKTITTNGVTIDRVVSFSAVGGGWTLVDNFNGGAARSFSLVGGTVIAANVNVSLGSFSMATANAKTLTLGNGTWTCASGWDAATNGASLTVSTSTGTINMTSASAKTFAGGGKTWPTLNQGGAGALTITGANTFANITNTVQPATITFPASTTTTVSAFGVSGTSGDQITINSSTPGTRATLFDAAGVVSVNFCTIQDIDAAGGAVWNAYVANGNVDGGNNVDWDFGGVPPAVTEVTYRIRSFTETRRF